MQNIAPFFEIPAIVLALFWFGAQLIPGVLFIGAGTAAVGGIAWWAHIGGFAAGWVLMHGPNRGKSSGGEAFKWDVDA